MKISLLKTSAILIAATVVVFAACKRNSSNDTASTDDQTSVATHATLERDNNDVENIADVAYQSGGANLRLAPADLGSCATVTNNTSVTPYVLTIDFGTTNCLCADGRNRRGKIIVTYTKGYKDSGSVHIITFDNYYIDDNQLTGSKTVTNMGKNADGHYYYDITVNDSLNLGPGNGIISWSSTRRRTWVEGYTTTTRMDDVYEVTGSATITRADGKVITIDITSPLRMAIDCKWMEAGTVKITRPSGGTMVIDYGTGSCDAEAQLTIGSHTYHITLR